MTILRSFLLIVSLAVVANAAEKPNFNVVPAERPVQAIEPRPESVPLPESPEAAKQDASPAAPQGAVARPVVYLYTSPACTAGDQMRAANARGEFVGLDVQEREPPDWYTLCPTFHWSSSDGQSGFKYPRDANSFRGVSGMLMAFDQSRPGERFIAVSAKPMGTSPFDQIQKFTGAGGSFVFKPDSPINAALDDRTSIKYPSIQGRYVVSNGVVTLRLDPPLPAGNYRKFLNFGFQITGAAGPENVTANSMDLRIDTNRGPQRMTLQMEPAK